MPDLATVTLRPQTRGEAVALTLDSTTYEISSGDEVTLRRSEITLPLVRLNNQHFFSALHEKLAL